MPVVNFGEAYQLALSAGANPDEAKTLAAIAGAESSYDTSVVSKPNTNGTVDRGLWQINSVHSQYDPNQLTTDPSYNAKAALDILRGQGWKAWTTYTNGAYKQFLSGDPNAVGAAAVTAGAQLGAATSTAGAKDSLESRLLSITDFFGGGTTKPDAAQQSPTQAVSAVSGGATVAAAVSGVAQKAIDAAMTAVGQPYTWGGNDLGSGVDCSGLIQQAYRAAGVDLPRVSNDQANSGTQVSFEEAQPGDILWWDYGAGSQVSGADHVALYLGNGKMIEALHRGLPVHVVDVRRPDGVTRVSGGATPPAQLSTTPQREVTPDMSIGARLASISAAMSGAPA